ncbi:MAG: ribokinase [Bacillaceae bacterium]
MLVVGSLNMDFLIDVEKMPLVGETILGKKLTLVPGGKGANQAYALGKLGGNVGMIGAVGKDQYGDRLLDNLKSVGVDTSGVEILETAPTGNAFITVNEQGENSIIVIQGANSMLSTEMIDKHIEMIDECDMVIMQLEIPLEVVSYVVKLAKERNKRVLLDPAPARCDIPNELFQHIDIVKPNETELQTLVGRQLTSKEDLVSGARELLNRGIKTVIVTLGGEGSLFVTKDFVKEFPANKVDVVDTTAAGDSFTAAVSIALGNGASYEEAITFGNKVSGIVVTRKGAQTSIPTLDEVNSTN